MTDVLTEKQRSYNMSRIKGKDTEPEILIRKRLFQKGFRYRLHSSNLPGKPDIVLPKYKAVIFIHGCFWHYHKCNLSKLPETRYEWWKAKLEGNHKRDLNRYKQLKDSGWRVLVVWECSFRGPKKKSLHAVIDRISRFVHSCRAYSQVKG